MKRIEEKLKNRVM